jgi:hypothetical protein
MRQLTIIFLIATIGISESYAEVVSTASSSISVNYQATTAPSLIVNVGVLPPDIIKFSDGTSAPKAETSTNLLALSGTTTELGSLFEASADADASIFGNRIPASSDLIAAQLVALSFENPTSNPVDFTIGGTFELTAESRTDEPLPSLSIADAIFEVGIENETLFERTVTTASDFGPNFQRLEDDWSIDLTVAASSVTDLEILTLEFLSTTSFQAVPEPNSSLLLLLLLLGICLRREFFNRQGVRNRSAV